MSQSRGMNWNFRSVISWLAAPFLVVLYLNIEELAVARGWNGLLVKVMPAVLDFLTTPPAFAISAFFVGLAVGSWINFLTYGRRKSQSEELLAPRSVLRLKFSGKVETPLEVFEDNIQSWFTFWSQSFNMVEDSGREIVNIHPSFAMFVVFKKPVQYRQAHVSFIGGEPATWQVQQSLGNSIVITMSGPIPECEMEISTK